MKIRGNISKSQSLIPEQVHLNVDSPFKQSCVEHTKTLNQYSGRDNRKNYDHIDNLVDSDQLFIEVSNYQILSEIGDEVRQ